MKKLIVMAMVMVFCLVGLAQAGDWQYFETDDEMGRGKLKQATVVSENTVELAFPYAGAHSLCIVLGNGPKDGKTVMFYIAKGQILAGFNARFDGGKEQHYSTLRVASGEANGFFVANPTKFIANIRKAKTLLIETTFFHHGNHVFKFDVSGLEWK